MRVTLYAELNEEQAKMKSYLVQKGYSISTLLRNFLLDFYLKEKNKEVATQLP